MSGHRPSFNPFSSGAAFVLYEGSVSTNAELEIAIGNDSETIPLQAGEVSGIHGGEECWVDDLSVRFVPHGTVHGSLKITAVCGRNFTQEGREWFNKLSEKEYNARMREYEQKRKKGYLSRFGRDGSRGYSPSIR